MSVASNDFNGSTDQKADTPEDAARRVRAEEARINLANKPQEVGGPNHEPTRYGDWAKNGRVSDF